MKYKCIAFDMDGTLIDSERVGLVSLQATIKKLLHKDVTLKDLYFSLGIPGEKAIEMIGFEDNDEALSYWDYLYLQMREGIVTFEGADTILSSLKEKGYLLGLVTSGFKKDVENHLVRLGLDVYFDSIVTAQDTIKHKPEAEPLLKLLENLNLEKEEVLYVGDSKYDAKCAQNARIDFALAKWGSRHTGINAKYALESILDVLKIV